MVTRQPSVNFNFTNHWSKQAKGPLYTVLKILQYYMYRERVAGIGSCLLFLTHLSKVSLHSIYNFVLLQQALLHIVAYISKHEGKLWLALAFVTWNIAKQQQQHQQQQKRPCDFRAQYYFPRMRGPFCQTKNQNDQSVVTNDHGNYRYSHLLCHYSFVFCLSSFSPGHNIRVNRSAVSSFRLLY